MNWSSFCRVEDNTTSRMLSRSVLVLTVYKLYKSFPFEISVRIQDTCVINWQMCRSSQSLQLKVVFRRTQSSTLHPHNHHTTTTTRPLLPPPSPHHTHTTTTTTHAPHHHHHPHQPTAQHHPPTRNMMDKICSGDKWMPCFCHFLPLPPCVRTRQFCAPAAFLRSGSRFYNALSRLVARSDQQLSMDHQEHNRSWKVWIVVMRLCYEMCHVL